MSWSAEQVERFRNTWNGLANLSIIEGLLASHEELRKRAETAKRFNQGLLERIAVSPDPETGVFVAEFGGMVSSGKTPEEAAINALKVSDMQFCRYPQYIARIAELEEALQKAVEMADSHAATVLELEAKLAGMKTELRDIDEIASGICGRAKEIRYLTTDWAEVPAKEEHA